MANGGAFISCNYENNLNLKNLSVGQKGGFFI
jgi:hypothetical protein